MSSGFVSEKELDEKRRVRQEEWEKVRSADEPLEAPEETYDPRSLFDRLEEQRKKKDDEFEEAHKLKNMVRGLDDDEVEFLDTVERVKESVEKRARLEERKEINEFRNAVASLAEKCVEERLKHEISKPVLSNRSGSNQKSSQMKLLAGAVVRKRPSSSDPSPPLKKAHVEKCAEDDQSSSPEDVKPKEGGTDIQTESTEKSDTPGLIEAVAVLPATLKCVGILPGLGSYPDSSDSECSSESECEMPKASPFDLLGRTVVHEEQQYKPVKQAQQN